MARSSAFRLILPLPQPTGLARQEEAGRQPLETHFVVSYPLFSTRLDGSLWLSLAVPSAPKVREPWATPWGPIRRTLQALKGSDTESQSFGLFHPVRGEGV
jgi:hypothetical protein